MDSPRHSASSAHRPTSPTSSTFSVHQSLSSSNQTPDELQADPIPSFLERAADIPHEGTPVHQRQAVRRTREMMESAGAHESELIPIDDSREKKAKTAGALQRDHESDSWGSPSFRRPPPVLILSDSLPTSSSASIPSESLKPEALFYQAQEDNANVAPPEPESPLPPEEPLAVIKERALDPTSFLRLSNARRVLEVETRRKDLLVWAGKLSALERDAQFQGLSGQLGALQGRRLATIEITQMRLYELGLAALRASLSLQGQAAKHTSEEARIARPDGGARSAES